MDKVKRIVLIAPFKPYLGGIAHFNDLLYEKMLSEGLKVLPISWKNRFPNFFYPGTQINKEHKNILQETPKFILHYINPISWLKAAWQIRNFKANQVIFNWVTPFLSPIFACLIIIIRLFVKDVKIGFICHNIRAHEQRWIDKLLTNLAFNKADFYIVHSENDAAYFKEKHPKKNIRVAFHPTYKDLKKRSKPSNYFSKINLKYSKTILFFGYIRPYKGLKILLKSLPLVVKELKVNLIIAGSFWEDKKIYTDLIKELEIEAYVTIYDNYIPDEVLSDLFELVDVVALPYLATSQSGVVQLSFGFNTPVIVTRVGGIAEAVRHQQTGLVMFLPTAEMMAAAIIEFYQKNWQPIMVKNIKKEMGSQPNSWNKYIKLLIEENAT